jgi:hypothetical protein
MQLFAMPFVAKLSVNHHGLLVVHRPQFGKRWLKLSMSNVFFFTSFIERRYHDYLRVGRIGAESLAVAQNNYAVLWFKGKELNMVFGLQLSFARVGSTVNFNVMEPLYKWVSKYYSGYMCIGVVLIIGKLLINFTDWVILSSALFIYLRNVHNKESVFMFVKLFPDTGRKF